MCSISLVSLKKNKNLKKKERKTLRSRSFIVSFYTFHIKINILLVLFLFSLHSTCFFTCNKSFISCCRFMFFIYCTAKVKRIHKISYNIISLCKKACRKMNITDQIPLNCSLYIRRINYNICTIIEP